MVMRRSRPSGALAMPAPRLRSPGGDLVSQRRRGVLLAAVFALAGCAGPGASPEPAAGAGAAPAAGPGATPWSPVATRAPLLAPWTVIAGGFLSPPTPPTLPMQPMQPAPALPPGPYTLLNAPSAVALMGNDLLIVDQGAQRLYRFDVARMTLTPWPPRVAVGPGMRVALARDGSAWVLDPVSARLVRFAPDGRVLLTLRDPNLFPAPVDFGLRELRAELVVLDATLAHWVTVRYGAGPGLAIASRGPWTGAPAALRALAVGADRLCVGASGAPALVCLRDGAQPAAAAWQVLPDDVAVRPGAMALDRHGRLYVADERARALHVYAGDGPVARVDYATLGVTSIAGIAIDGSFLAIADEAAGRVALYSIQAPPR